MSHNHHTETLSPKESMPAVEIHRYSKVIDYFRRRIESLHSKNSSTALKFLDALLLYGTGKGRVASYAAFAFKIIQLANEPNILSDKSMAEWKKEDVDLLAKSVIEKNCSGTTKHLFVLTLKRLVHFAKHGVIIEKKDGIDYCDEVKHLSPSRFRKEEEKVEKIKPQDLLTPDEFLQLIDAIPKVSANVKRDTAALYVAKEYAGRPGEVLNMTVSGVEFKDAYCTVTTNGKTGQKTLTLVLSYKPLLDWLQHHPERDNPNAYLFYADNKFGRITYTYLQRLLKRCAKVAGIKKRVWLYLLRHTQLTEIEKTFGSGITNIYGNWGRGSTMRERYVHLANSDQQRAILSKYGLLKGEEETLLKPKSCPRCSEQNSPDKKRCVRCGFILDHKLAITYARKEQNATKFLEKRVKRVEQVVKENTDMIKEILDHIKPKASEMKPILEAKPSIVAVVVIVALTYPLCIVHEYVHVMVCESYSGTEAIVTIDGIRCRTDCVGLKSDPSFYWFSGGMAASLVAFSPLAAYPVVKRNKVIMIVSMVWGFTQLIFAFMETFANQMYLAIGNDFALSFLVLLAIIFPLFMVFAYKFARRY